MKINIAAPEVGEEEIEAVAKVMRTGILAQGPEVYEFEKEFAEFCGTKHAVATSNGSTALLVALEVLKAENPNNFYSGGGGPPEVITTPFTFLASASSIMLAGMKPVFVDIDPETFNLDVDQVEKALTARTLAIMPVHLYGQACDMNKIKKLTDKEPWLKVIEDCAQAHGATLDGKKAGSFGDMGCFSFYPTKNMTTAEGGMITTNNDEYARIARLIRAHGMSAPYQYDYLGFNYRMTSISAAIGRVQLAKLGQWTKARQANADYYNRYLKNVETPKTLSGAVPVYHQYTIKCDNPEKLKNHLAANEIGSNIYYPEMLYNFDIMKDYKASCPVGERVCKQVLSLPVHPNLSQEDLEKVVQVINNFTK